MRIRGEGRHFRQALALAGALIAIAWAGPGCAAETSGRDDSASARLGWRLALQAWTVNHLTAFEAIDRARELGLKAIELFPGQRLSPERDVPVNEGMSREDRDLLKRKLREAGVALVNFGVTGLSKDEAASRRVFEFARDLGIETICSEPPEDAFDTIDRLCAEFGINVAIHNHPKPSHYWNPDTVLAACRGRSRRIGACADTGHWMRSGVNPVEALRKLEGRIITFHFKDLNEFGNPGARDVPWGTGAGDARAMLAEVRRQGFTGTFSIEYEYNSPQLLDEVGQCVAAFDRIAGELASRAPAETGAVPLFNGRDFRGWAFSNAAQRRAWSVRQGVLYTRGQPFGYLRTAGSYANFILRLEFRHLAPGNGGVLVRMVGPDKVWPKSIECQGRSGDAGDIWRIGQFPMTVDPARTEGRRTVKLKASSERPIGEWNTYEIILDGGELMVRVNGVLQNTATGCQEVPGKICLQSEGGAMEFRNIRLVPLPPRQAAGGQAS